MKLLDLTIYGFGKFYQKTWTFQDGIHVIYGPNEAGKSTLHSFLGCMLFGLERGRGRAARTDRYSRYLPWDHDGTYGGSLSFEQEDGIYQLQRSFRSDRRACQLTSPHGAPVACSQEQLIQEHLDGLTESLYYNTISIRSLGCAPDSSLAQELSQQLALLQQSGTDTIDYHSAMNWLRTQRKHYESLLTPDLEAKILARQQDLAQMEERLQNTAFREQKAALEMDMEDCLTQLSQPRPSQVLSSSSSKNPSVTMPSQESTGYRRRPRWGLLLLAILLAAGAFLAWMYDYHTVTYGLSGASLLFALLGLLLPKSVPCYDSPDQEDSEEDEEETTGTHRPTDSIHDPLIDPTGDPSLQRIRQRLQSLQKQYEEVCHQEWEYHRLGEQTLALEEELQQLLLQEQKEQQFRLEIQAIALASSTLQQLSTQIQNDISPLLARSMSRILSSLTDDRYTQVYLDSQLHMQIQAGAHIVPLDSLSRGTIEQIYLAMRLALIDLLFPQGGMPLLLDDCFLAYDDQRLSQTLLWLAENYSGQVLIFTCQKREAALLDQQQIPFTHILL